MAKKKNDGIIPGYNDDVIDRRAACASGLLRAVAWSEVSPELFVIYPEGMPDQRAASIVTIEEDGGPRPNRVRTGHDLPVRHLRIVTKQMWPGGSEKTYVAAESETVYVADKPEPDGGWPMCRRTFRIYAAPPTGERLEKMKKQEASERRRKKKAEKRRQSE